MAKSAKFKSICAALILILNSLHPPLLLAKDSTESAAVGIGVSAGNMWFVPIKAISVLMGVTAGALSFVVSGGNADLTRQIWEDSTRGPYLITPEVVQRAIGERPELIRE